ncbi:hypothetical protein DQ04_23161010 [Trypanosoma grayi]|uniref:hypothetical protein n=1 Tax=Trypanosoma grayi TaxID=71804 RepID=UPI0004F429DD|nr:hypothetical protein DQ04_23161010 [Trypanosoma grayi]KEG05348.1 hypothetical protein DQ04_23161010 [Trypanosoma grayi]
MLRRSLFRFFTLAESRAMFLDANGTPLPRPTATLAETLQVLAQHHRRGDAAVTHAALGRLLSLDATDEESATIAAFKACTTPVSTTTSTTTTTTTTPSNNNNNNGAENAA